jgi:hypothetical protein
MDINIPMLLGLIACLIGLLVFVALAIGLGLMIRDTVRKKGNWGINLNPVICPSCGEPATTLRKPASGRQAIWGGQTCSRCGTEFDKWGRAVPGPNE